MNEKPEQCQGCALEQSGKRFALDYGDPARAKLGIFLEAPGFEEISYDLTIPKMTPWKTIDQERTSLDAREFSRRRVAYGSKFPDLVLRRGCSLVGASWFLFDQWFLRKFGLQREDLYIANSLRCLPPERNGKHYPVGKDRTNAEAKCRQYDRWEEFFGHEIVPRPKLPDGILGITDPMLRIKPGICFVTFHPASLFRELTPFHLMLRTFSKAKDCIDAGIKTVILMGEHAIHVWLGYYDTPSRTQGHWEWTTGPKGFSANAESGQKPEKRKRKKSLRPVMGEI